jgi:peptide/nickel transport system substrate-binding protein
MYNQADSALSCPAIETLIRLDEGGNPIPWLATKWEISSDQRKIILHLRQGVKFHDGTPFNAQAAKWNFDEYRSKAIQGVEMKKVESVDVVDEYTIRLNLSATDNLLIHYLAIFPGMMISPTAFEKNGGKDWAIRNPVGTGPFTFKSWQRDVKVVYKRFDGYWQKGQPYLDGVEFQIIVDPMVKSAALKKGEVNVAVEIAPQEAANLAKESGLTISTTARPEGLWWFAGDNSHPDSPFAKLKVRQALAHAIENEVIIDRLGYGYLIPVNQGAGPKSWAFNPNLNYPYSYDPEKAKQLLAEAGYPSGFKTVINAPNIAPLPDVAAAMQGYLANVGIKATINVMDAASWSAIVTGGWDNSIMVDRISSVPHEYGAISRNFARAVYAKRYPSMKPSEDTMKALDEAGATMDQNIIKASVHSAQQAIVDDAMMNWLYVTPGIAAKQSRVQGDNLYTVMPGQWTPEAAYLTK